MPSQSITWIAELSHNPALGLPSRYIVVSQIYMVDCSLTDSPDNTPRNSNRITHSINNNYRAE